MVPGIDYIIHGEEGITGERSCVAFPESASNLRHEWVMVKRRVPAVPKFEGGVLKRGGNKDDNARSMSIYFRPWVLDTNCEPNEHVPHVSNLCEAGLSWRQSWKAWCNGGVLCERVKWYITNFQVNIGLQYSIV
jgi:hypothetical protein